MEDKDKYTWYRISSSKDDLKDSFNEKGLMSIKAGGQNICILENSKGIFAVNAKCPHAGGPLSEGYIDANGHIVCPWHRYKFDPNTGLTSGEESFYVKRYPIDETDEGMFVGIIKKKLGFF